VTQKKLSYIDLFAGCGGLSEGFIRQGFSPIAHVEMDSNACKTLLTRTAYHYFKRAGKIDKYVEYLKGIISRKSLHELLPPELQQSVLNYEISKNSINDVFTKIDRLMLLNGIKKINVIIGGPPCQAYSLVGRSKIGKSVSGDKRNYLYRLYGKFLYKYNPDIFVFENVPGLYTAGNGKYYRGLKYYFKNLGYILEDKILNSSDFGVLQERKRIILIGWKNALNLSCPIFNSNKSPYTINDLFYDLPKLKDGEIAPVQSLKTDRNSKCLKDLKIYSDLNILIQHIARFHNDNDLKIYKMVVEKWSNGRERIKYCELPKELKTHGNQESFNDRFKVVDGNGYSHTMVAHIAKDGHYYIHPDINQLRSISVREAARIQSFPDDYFFESSRTSAFQQIGNAVPPLMAEKIAQKIMEMLYGK